MPFTQALLDRKDVFQSSELIPWQRDLNGDVFVAKLDDYYGKGNYVASQQIHRGGSGFGSKISASGRQLSCHDYSNDSGETLSRYDVAGLLSYDDIFKYFNNPEESRTISLMVELVQILDNNPKYTCPETWSDLVLDFNDALENIPDVYLSQDDLEDLYDIRNRLEIDAPEAYSLVDVLLTDDILNAKVDISAFSEGQLIGGLIGLYNRDARKYNFDADYTFADAAAFCAKNPNNYHEHSTVSSIIYKPLGDKVIHPKIKAYLAENPIELHDEDIVEKLWALRCYVYDKAVHEIPEGTAEELISLIYLESSILNSDSADIAEILSLNEKEIRAGLTLTHSEEYIQFLQSIFKPSKPPHMFRSNEAKTLAYSEVERILEKADYLIHEGKDLDEDSLEVLEDILHFTYVTKELPMQIYTNEPSKPIETIEALQSLLHSDDILIGLLDRLADNLETLKPGANNVIMAQ